VNIKRDAKVTVSRAKAVPGGKEIVKMEEGGGIGGGGGKRGGGCRTKVLLDGKKQLIHVSADSRIGNRAPRGVSATVSKRMGERQRESNHIGGGPLWGEKVSNIPKKHPASHTTSFCKASLGAPSRTKGEWRIRCQRVRNFSEAGPNAKVSWKRIEMSFK